MRRSSLARMSCDSVCLSDVECLTKESGLVSKGQVTSYFTAFRILFWYDRFRWKVHTLQKIIFPLSVATGSTRPIDYSKRIDFERLLSIFVVSVLGLPAETITQ